ncbi:EAL domain-containing protein [Oryzibacter oryziterrae]|uniref:EAL domain-containing protein n=1 Tax=Oryzibacter oryziterrae TaxID=2766474 RepID=UPI001F172C31|nr:EAL domain-containing protein [Oryzibacter oryziterrae]
MVPTRSRPSAVRVALHFGLVTTLLALLWATGALDWLNRWQVDQRFSLASRPPTGQIVLVDIDARSLAKVGTWPWDRGVYADLIDRLRTLKAAQIALDIDFSARSTPQADARLADAIARSDSPIFLASFAQRAGTGTAEMTLNKPIDALLAAGWPALVNVPVDGDGRVRTFTERLSFQGETIEALPGLLAGVSELDRPIVIDFSIDRRALVHLSAADLLSGDVSAAAVAGKTVIIGATAVELHDFLQVPRWGILAGPEVIALAAETLLQLRNLTADAHPAAILLLVALALGLSMLPMRPAMIGLLGLAAVTQTAAAILQISLAAVLDTAALDVAIICLLALMLLREYDVRGVLLRIARIEKSNADRLLQRVVDDGFDAILILDQADQVVRSNRAARNHLGPAASGAALPPALTVLLHKVRAEAAERDTPLVDDIEVVSPDGRRQILECALAAFEMEGARRQGALSYVCITLRDVTEGRKAAARMRRIALQDALTGLPNRSGLLEGLTAGEGTLVCLDLDRFRSINDAFGEAAGDQVLIEVGKRIGRRLAGRGTVARIGSDEFAISLPGPVDAAEALVAELTAELAEPAIVNAHRISLGAAFGVAGQAAGTPPDAARLLGRASLALSRARKAGRGGSVVFDAGMEAEDLERLQLEQELRQALDRGELVAAYQPQVDLGTSRVVGAEMLMRWLHPTRGPVSPGVFIPIAEQSGLIHQLTAWAIARACADAVAWPRPIRIAVNVSAIDLQAGDVPATVRQALSASGLDPGRLDLEITESVFVAATDTIAATFAALRGLGVNFALDDFGTGYASLGYLNRLPLSKLKMDKSFVDHIATKPQALAMADGIIHLAHNLGLALVAEGIETDAQRQSLAGLGCDIGQGWLFSKAISNAEITELLRRDNPL